MKKHYQLLQWVVLVVVASSIALLLVVRARETNPESYGIQSLAQDYSLAVIVFNRSSDSPFNIGTVQDTFFNNEYSVVNYFSKASFGRVNMTKSGAGVYPVTYNLQSCSNYQTWTRAARSTIYASYYVYILPGISGCSPLGGQTVGGWSLGSNTNEVWMNGTADLGTGTHELMHDLGFYHAGTCNGYSNGDCASVSQQNDPYDIMGNNFAGHVSGYKKLIKTWISSSNVQTITGGNDTYTLNPINLPVGGVQLIKVPVGGAGRSLYLEYHFANADAFERWGDTAPAANGITIRLAPFTASVNLPDTAFVTIAPVGQPFISGNIVITPCSAGPTVASATVQIRFDGSQLPCGTAGSPPPCIHNPPSISVDPSVGTGNPGDKVIYKVKVTNNDTNCAPTTFDYTAAMSSAGLRKMKPASRSETLSNGDYIISKFKVFSSDTATAGYYDVPFVVTTNDNIPQHAPVAADPVPKYQVGTIAATSTALDAQYSPFSTLTLCGKETDVIVSAGTPCSLVWSLDYASSPTTCKLNSTDVANSGSMQVTINSSVTYKLICTSGTSTALTTISATVDATQPPPATSPTPSCSGGYVRVTGGATYVGPGSSSTPGGVWRADVGAAVQLSPGTGYTSGQYTGISTPASVSGNTLTSTGPADVYVSGSDWILYNGASGCALGAAEVRFGLPDFSLACSPSSVSVSAGKSTSYTASISPFYGFNSPVTLSIQSVSPKNSTITSSGSTVSPPYYPASFPVSTTSTTSVQAYSLMIQAVGGGLTRTCLVPPTLNVTSWVK